ncbi:hypothetical protein AB7309_04940 [Providencia manganoxydans]|uniref:hypothetical protein n=1 Tax=Providencia manganoxydans TaxID=2923283 RepID=UPI0034E4778E
MTVYRFPNYYGSGGCIGVVLERITHFAEIDLDGPATEIYLDSGEKIITTMPADKVAMVIQGTYP